MSLLGLNASNAILFYPHTLTVKNRSGSLPGCDGDGILTCGRKMLPGLMYRSCRRLGKLGWPHRAISQPAAALIKQQVMS